MINRITNNSMILQNMKKTENKEKNSNFVDLIKDYIDDVNKKQIDADKTIERFIKGEEKDITNVVLSVEKAEVSLQLFLQIRNKLVQAYQDIMRMQV